MLIGCCGACCGACRVLAEGQCRGCKLGYGGGARDISRARCRIKYGRYLKPLEFIRERGCRGFLSAARGWKGACGRL